MQKIYPKFTEEQYNRLLLIMEDRENFPDSHARWYEVAQNFMEYHARRGVAVYCVDVDPDSLADWCKTQGLKVNNASLSEFTIHDFNKLVDSIDHPRKRNYAPLLSDQLLNLGLIDSESEDN